jgi:hypothetical protein
MDGLKAVPFKNIGLDVQAKEAFSAACKGLVLPALKRVIKVETPPER